MPMEGQFWMPIDMMMLNFNTAVDLTLFFLDDSPNVEVALR